MGYPLYLTCTSGLLVNFTDSSDLRKKASNKQNHFKYDENKSLSGSFTKRTCPNCKFEGAYGSMWNCGTSLNPTDYDPNQLGQETPVLRHYHWYRHLKHSEWLPPVRTGSHKGTCMIQRNEKSGGSCNHARRRLQPRAWRETSTGAVMALRTGSQKVKMYVWLRAHRLYVST